MGVGDQLSGDARNFLVGQPGESRACAIPEAHLHNYQRHTGDCVFHTKGCPRAGFPFPSDPGTFFGRDALSRRRVLSDPVITEPSISLPPSKKERRR